MLVLPSGYMALIEFDRRNHPQSTPSGWMESAEKKSKYKWLRTSWSWYFVSTQSVFCLRSAKAFTDTVWESQWPCDDSEEIKRPKTGFQLTIQRQIQVLNRGKKFLSLWYHWQFYDPLFSSWKRSAWQPCYPTSSWHCYLKRRRRIPNIFALAGFAYTCFGSEHAVWNLGRVWRLDYG
jgi:hypothetical protein